MERGRPVTVHLCGLCVDLILQFVSVAAPVCRQPPFLRRLLKSHGITFQEVECTDGMVK